MIRYLLDTTACLALIGGRSPKLLARLRRCRGGEVGISSLTLAELYGRVARSSDPARNMAALAQFCAPLVVAPFDERAAAVAGTLDLDERLLAAHALALDVALISERPRDFRRARGLDVRSWSA